ncbi:MAG: carbonic anhydrase [Deltaproteobacteria bacterium]|nr:MAG: carbonic anhydrase [Deltaproteobacteria bacterium]
MKKLIRGIVEFRKNVRSGYRETFAHLALGQSPDALLIACSDSRVVPNLFASTEPGDLFVIRNPGNLIAPCGEDGRSVSDESEAAAIEFAMLSLGVPDIIVCGHSDCGAMRTALDGMKSLAAPHLEAWLRHAEGALRQVREGHRMKAEFALHNHLSQFNVLEQLKHLRSYPAVRERLEAGRLRLHAWWFDIARAEVLAYDDARHEFVVIDEAEADRLLKRLGEN